ncbi:MAG TPA: right-handed parallel beta-helix repeat-containing protein [Solirubrobacterales bacterium]|nr:right-handed parallel beta-helix repeat-containing protein [Solirubrobacterales bacterium]
MKNRFVRLMLSLVVLAVVGTPLAHAQATRTWVSGVGDDANPCSRTAPCKTFAGAISKTAPGGEINVLDPGGFGAVTITKPITISSWSFEAGVLVSGTNGIVVSVPNATDTVILRGLDIEGLGTGISGVTVLTGGNVTVENCTINAFTVSGINFATTVSGSQLHVVDTVVRNNGSFSGATGQGVLVGPTASATASFERVRFEHNVAGLKTQGSVNTTVSNSVSTNNAFAGYSGFNTGAVLTVEKSVASHNGTGVVCNAGSTVRLGNMVLTDNGTDVSSGGSCLSFKNNDAQTTIPVTAISPTPQ